jgi:hypothetical protein
MAHSDDDFQPAGDVWFDSETDEETGATVNDPFSRAIMELVLPIVKDYITICLSEDRNRKVCVSREFLVSLLQEGVRVVHFFFSSFPLSDEDVMVVLDQKPFCPCGTFFSEGELLPTGKMSCPKCGKIVFEG